MNSEELLSSLKIEHRKDSRLYGSEGDTIGLYSTYDVVFPSKRKIHVHETLLTKARVLRVPDNELGRLLIFLTTLSHKKEQHNPNFPFDTYPNIIYRTNSTEDKKMSIISEWWSKKEISSPTFEHHVKELKIEFGIPILHDKYYLYQFSIGWDEIVEVASKEIKSFK